MKILSHLLLTQTFVALIAASVVWLAMKSNSSVFLTAGFVFPIAAIIVTAWWTSRRLEKALLEVEAMISNGDSICPKKASFREFDLAAERIGKYVEKWELIASKTREQTRDFKAMMLMLNDRRPSGEASSTLLREILGGLGSRIQAHLRQIETSADEIQKSSESVVAGADAQTQAVTKATSHLERLAETIDEIAALSATAHEDTKSNISTLTSALNLIETLSGHLQRIRTESQNSEKRIQGLCDPTRQITNIVTTIGEITAKTDLLALNASIESIRAGELGSGFAVVAEEVRRLAEQTCDATREITSILESMQVVTQESLRIQQAERAEVDAATDCVGRFEGLIELVIEASKRDDQCLRDILKSSNQQLQIAQDVILSVEQISQIAKSNRSGAENVCWIFRSLMKAQTPFNSVVERLKGCNKRDETEQLGRDQTLATKRISIAPVNPPLLQSISGEFV